MDGDRFDELSRLLAGAASRQRVFRLLIGAGVSGLAALVGGGDGERPVLETEAKKKRKKRKRRKRRSNGRCPDQHDRVCHCPPGDTDNCHTTGDGGGHENHELDCCCTRNGRRNPGCSCDGNECCKPAGTDCANSSQCCNNGTCANIVGGRGVCVTPTPNCVPLTCADFPDQCGPQDDGCGGQTADCACPDPTDDCVGGVCVGPSCEPLTCADFSDQCGTFADGCDGEIDCACASGGCCDGVCEDGVACCQANDCPRQPCQDRACNDGTCEYTPVEDGEPGPLCIGQGRLCCEGACLSDGQCCTVEDCQEQACQTVECVDNECVYTPVQDGGQGPLCTGGGEFCCNASECCGSAEICFAIGCCSPQTEDEACAGSNVECGVVSDGCEGEYDCGDCQAGQTCLGGACVSPRRGKRCKGKGLAGHPCKGKKCKCKAGRRCHNKRCCEPVSDGSRHCNANRDCCPGLTCIRKSPDQHKVCLRKGSRSDSLDLVS